MTTKAEHFIDLIVEAPTRSAMASWFNNPVRELSRIWISPADVAGPDDDREPNNWNGTYVGVAPELILDPPLRSLWYLRMLQDDYLALLVAAPPSDAVNIVETIDPFAPLIFIDKNNPTDDEFNANNIWRALSLDNDNSAKVREYFPFDTGVDDGAGGTIKQGLKFGAFNENVKDYLGSGES